MKLPASFSKTCMAALFAFAASPALADGLQSADSILLPDGVACEGDESQIVGRVVARDGVAKAYRQGESEPRSLACNDVIHACETVTTEAGARVGILTRDVYAHLGSGSRLQIGGAENARLSLDAGRVRLIDPRKEGSPSVIVQTPHLSAAAQGADTEFFVSAGGASTRLCNHLASVDVTSGDSSLALAAACAVSSGERISEMGSADPTIDVQDAPSCEFDVASLLEPTIDIAAFGMPAFPDAGAAGVFGRGACEASACGVNVTPTPPASNPRPPTPRTPRAAARILVDPDPDAGTGGAGFSTGPPPRP